MAQQNDPLGGMFTPAEKETLRGRDPLQQQVRDTLIVRLGDLFTFRRAPRGWQPPFDCLSKAGLIENVDTSRCELPSMSQDDLAKAEEVMKFVRQRIPQHAISVSSWATADELKDILKTSWNLWVNGGRDSNFASIIDRIPNRALINKVVCIGLSEMAARFDPMSERTTVISQCLAQHLAVMSIVTYLRLSVPHKVELFAADWVYDTAHKEALNSFGFTILDASYGKQEHFVEIDDHTMLISFAIPDFESIIPIISEYSRPVAIICDTCDYLTSGGHLHPPYSPVWSQVRYHDAWVTIPGPPLIINKTPSEPSAKNPSTMMPSWLPFNTKSSERFISDYSMAMNMFEFDVTGLMNRFELHPNTDHRPRVADETEQKRFVGQNSRLFVRNF